MLHDGLITDEVLDRVSIFFPFDGFQIQQSRQLCHLLWNLRGPLLPYTDLDFLPNL